MFHKGKYDREKQLRFSIRKVSFGAASVAVAALFMFLGNGAVSAAEQSVPSANGETQAPQPKEPNAQNGTYEGNTVATSPAATVETNTQPSTVENSPSTESAPQKVETLDKKELTDLIKEVDGKFAKGTYSTKTEESANNLRSVLEEARTVLSNAKTQAELSQAQAKLVTATTKLQKKPEEKKEVAAVDTTNGKATVGKKATNTEKSSESNSIANSGSKDKRNGKVLDTNNPFRTDAATTDTDPAANQTYTAPAADANLETLTKKLKTLPNYIENNKKVQDMDTLGNEKGVAAGSVAEITEFGGWKAVNQEDGSAGKFAIAKVTDKGVFPVETMNILGSAATAYVGEQSFDRTSKYMLFLSEVRTQATKIKEAYDNSAWSDSDGTFGKHTSKAVKGYNGIEKTFKVYSSDKNTKVNLEFKTGFSGHLDHPDGSSRANYKVEVFSIDSNNSETKVYEATFDSSVAKDNDDMKITPAKDSTSRRQSFNIPKNNKEAALEEFAKDVYKPYATGGTFTAKNINLPAGASSYKVRISTADNGRLGLDYHSNYESYALPVTGLDFNIDQDTGAIAKDLLSRIYDKLKATESADTDGKTNETKAAYLAELENIKTLVTSTDVKKTVEYKEALEAILSKQLALKVDKTGLTDSKALLDGLVNEDPTPGKTQDTAAAYNATKQEAIKAIEAAKTVIDNENATVAQVREALAAVNTKKTALQQAKDGLIEAATVEEKAKLKSDADLLTKADETGKTPESIKAYNRKYEALKAQLEAAKTEAATVLAKADNASKAEVQAAQTKVDAAKAELTKAAELLVNKADKTELTQAKEALSTLATEADPTTGKTADSAKAYNDAKTAAQEAVKEAETVINDENVTPEKVTEALNKVNEKKAALEAAKQALVEAATTEEKAKLKADADSLVKADETGKTPESIKAYNRKYEALKAQLEAAKTEAATVLAKADNASKAEVQAAQTKVDAAKAELTKAAELLVNKADKTELTQAKEALSTLATEADPTTGKTADSAKAYNDAKTDAQEAIKTAETVINDENATPEQVTAALNKVNEKKTALQQAKDGLIEAATVEEKAKLKSDADLLTKADETGKTPDSIAVYERKYEELKDQLEVAKAEADKVLAKGNNATKEEVKAAQAKVDAVKTELETAKNILVEAATTEEKTKLKTDSDALKKADTTGKTADSIKAYGAEFEKLKAQLEETKAEADKVLAKGNNATKEEVKAAQEKVDAVKTALDKAAESLKDLDRDAAKKEIADAAKKATDAIEASTSLTLEQKAEEKAKVAKEAKDATDAIDNATIEEGINSAKENGKLAIEKEAAISAIKATKEAKLSEIDKNTSLSDDEKAAAKAEVAKAATEAVEAIKKADTQATVEAAQAKGETAIKAVNPVGKEKALDAIQKAAEEKIAEIDKNAKLSSEEKAAAKAEVAKAAIEAVEAIQKAETQEAVNTAQAKGEATIKAVNPVGKEKALEAIKATKEAKLSEIDKNTSLSDDEKAASKAEVAKVAIEAVEAIQKAETQEAVNTAQSKGETAIKAVNPVGKEKALDAIQKAAEEKIAEIDKNAKLSAEEKAASKAEVAKAAIEAVEAIQKATTQEAVNAAQAKGEAAIKAVNPVGKEKALDAIQKAAEEKIAEIDKNAKLSSEEKAAAKAEVAKAAIEAVEAIQKAETQEAVNTAQAKGEATIKAVNPVGKAQAKAAIDKALAEKEKAIDARTDLTDAEKEVAKKSARAEAESAKKAIDNATDSEAVEKALRTFLYQIDQESLVYDRPAFNLEAYIQALITGVVKVERGKAITQADIISKLSLPENVTVISIDLPDTNTLGDKFAKVMLRLPDGTEVTVKVPVRVVASQNGDSKPETALPDYGRNNGSTNTEATVDKTKLEGAIRQLDELIIQESAKFDSETSKEATALSADAKKVFANADVSQAEVDAMVKRIEDFMAKVVSSTDHATPANDQDAQTPATAQAAANARKVAKELPNTGTADSTVAMVAAAASALLGLGLAGRRRKEDEEA